MGRITGRLRLLTRAPGVPKARHLTERSVAPYLRADLHALGTDHSATVSRLEALEHKVEYMMSALTTTAAELKQVEVHQPAILNAIASTNGTARVLTREVDALRASLISTEADERARVQILQDAVDLTRTTTAANQDRLETAFRELHDGDDAVRDEIRPHIASIAWLLTRVETVRAEIMHEIRYGAAPDEDSTPTQIVNPAALEADDLRINIGAGHLPMDGFVNVDLRELPGIDVVAPADDLPFEPGTLNEIFSSHTLEHFPELELRRRLLPYWFTLLREGGTIRAVVPDLEAMTHAYVAGKMPFEVFRAVAYGGQEYEGDFHFTGFTPSSMSALLTESGFENPTIIAEGRPNGDCLEFEIKASRPAG